MAEFPPLLFASNRKRNQLTMMTEQNNPETTTDSRVKKGLDDITECSVCLATFVDPRVLPCIHTFCRECLIQTYRQSGGDRMQCPICRSSFPLPVNGFDGLLKNFYMERLVEITRTLGGGPSVQTPCSVCSEEDGWSQAVSTMFCVDCQMSLCEQCCQHHRKGKLTSRHRLTDGARGQRSAEAQGSRALTCLEHEEDLRLFCSACDELVCPMCFIVNHKDHQWMRIEAAAKTFKDQIETQIEAMAACVEKTKAAKHLLQLEREKTDERAKGLEEKVLKVRDRLKELLDQRAEQVLRRLREEKHSRAKGLLTGSDDIERHLVSLESYRSYCSSILENGRDDEICRMAKELLSRASELKKQNEDVKQREPKHSDHNDVQSIRLQDICHSQNLIINFEEALVNCQLGEKKNAKEGAQCEAENAEKCEAKNTEKCEAANTATPAGNAQFLQLENPTPDVKTGKPDSRGFSLLQKPRLIRTLKTEASTNRERPPVWGVARLNSELFVLTGRDGRDVYVYDVTRCTLKRRWEVGGLRNPQDIIACETHKCLYIIDWKLKKILKYNSFGSLTGDWSVKGMGRLSVTPQSTVLFTSHTQNKLTEYDSAGKSLRTVNLGTINAPVHAVKLESGHYILNHGENFRQNVCIVDESGNVTKSYSRGTKDALGSAIHVIASREGFFLVANWANGTIVVLDSELKYKRTLLGSENGLRRPARMCLDENSRRLYVADNFSAYNDGQVLIFDI